MDRLNIIVAIVFLTLAAAVVIARAWAVGPDMWAEVDGRIVSATVLGTWLCFALAGLRRSEELERIS